MADGNAGQETDTTLQRKVADVWEQLEAVGASAVAEAVKAAQAAVFAAEASRQHECGNGEPKQRRANCRTRETEEGARRKTLTQACVFSRKYPPLRGPATSAAIGSWLGSSERSS
jgi:hypothetical protein